MDRQLQEYIKSLREAKAVINSAIVISAAEGIVKSHDSLLTCLRVMVVTSSAQSIGQSTFWLC